MPGMTIITTIALAVIKNLFARIAKPDKIAEFLVKWLAEIAAKDDKTDWKDRLAELLKDK